MKTITVTCTLILLSTQIPVQAQTPVIVAHRGASYDAPENTIPAFELAWKQNADAIEGDFYLTHDKKIVCIHDKTTKRYSDKNLDVASSTYEELSQLDVGAYKNPGFRGTRIPLISDVLATIPAGKKIYVEIKCGPEIIPYLRKELTASKLKPEQIIIISFSSQVIKQIKSVSPEYKAYWLMGFKKEGNTIKPSVEKVVETLDAIGADGFSSSHKHLTELVVKSVRKRGYEYHVWTVNDPQVARRVDKWGAQSITTDRPALIRQAFDKGKN